MQSAHRMRSFIDDLLRYSHATHHTGSNLTAIDVDVILTQVLFHLDAVIQSKNARITHDPLPQLFADARIEHVLQNLISNAIKYSRPGVTPEIHVSARKEEGCWQIAVRDNGIGIEPQYTEGIFQVFRRLHGRDVAGNGIGLALAQKIVEANGGKIWVESEPGVGSTFYFTVPIELVRTLKSSRATS
jgi:light-regulated signal transduction histidine kinase (bacteriophytochrome)